VVSLYGELSGGQVDEAIAVLRSYFYFGTRPPIATPLFLCFLSFLSVCGADILKAVRIPSFSS
jgi:hypothetical protein